MASDWELLQATRIESSATQVRAVRIPPSLIAKGGRVELLRRLVGRYNDDNAKKREYSDSFKRSSLREATPSPSPSLKERGGQTRSAELS